MSELSDVVKGFVGDFRYGITIVSAFVLGLLLLFFEDLDPSLRQIVIPSLVVYTIGTALIACIQILLTASANTKAVAREERARGIPEGWLAVVILLHMLWFAALVAYNVYRGSIVLFPSPLP